MNKSKNYESDFFSS